MVCRETKRVFGLLALLSFVATAWSAEPGTNRRERIRIASPTNSLRYTIRDPAIGGLTGPAATPRKIQAVSHEALSGFVDEPRIMVSQLGNGGARDAVDALRSVTDDLDFDLPQAEKAVPNKAIPLRRTTPDITPRTTPSSPRTTPNRALDQLRTAPPASPTKSALDAIRAEQRKRELQELLRSVSEKDDDDSKLDLDLESDDQDSDTEPDYDDVVDSEPFEPISNEPSYNRQSNYDQIPWRMSGLFDDPADYQKQCREQEFCRRMWECAGGRCQTPMERWQRNARRTYELLYGSCPCSNPTPLLAGMFIEPLLGYGFFGAPMTGCGNGSCGGGGSLVGGSFAGGISGYEPAVTDGGACSSCQQTAGNCTCGG